MRQRDVIQRRYELFEKRTDHLFQEPTRERLQEWELTFSQLFYEPWKSEGASQEEAQEQTKGYNANRRAKRRKQARR